MSQAFPLLKVTEIIQICHELDIALTPAELKEPSEAVVAPVYEMFLECIVNIERKDLVQPAVEQIESDVSEASLSQARFIREVIKMMHAVGMEEFGLADVLCPTGDRFKRALSAIINFAKFREDYLERHNTLTLESEQLSSRIAALTRTRDATLEDLDAMKQAKQKEADALNALHSEVAALEGRQRDMKQEQLAIKEKVNELRIESNDLATFVNESKVRVRTLEEDIAAAKDRIVPSPDRTQAEMNELVRIVDSAKANVANLTKTQRSLQNKEQAVTDKEHQLEQRLEGIRDCVSSLDRVTALETENTTRLNRSREILTDITDLKSQETQIQSELEMLDNRMFRVQSEFEKKRLAAEEALKSVQQQREQLREDQKKAKSRGEANEATYRLRQQELKSLQSEHEDQIAKVKRKFASLEHCILAYHAQLQSAMRSRDMNAVQNAVSLGAAALAAAAVSNSDDYTASGLTSSLTTGITSSLTSTIHKQSSRVSGLPR